MKTRVDIVKNIMRIDTNTECFDMQEIQNRRFIYNPQTGILLLSVQLPDNFSRRIVRKDIRSGDISPNSEVISGWVGTDGKYANGIIHFAPPISRRYSKLLKKGFSTLKMFSENNADNDTVIRGFPNRWEQSLNNIFTERQVDLMADKPNMQQAATSTKEPPKAPSVTPIVLEGKTQKDKLQEIAEKLQQGVKDIFSSDKYKEYLNVMSKFHHYSFRNTMLILMQKPDASMLAGYGAWGTKFKRQVNRGEKGIKIIAPTPYKTQKEIPLLDQKTKQPIFRPDGTPLMQTVDVTIPAYKVTTVFDVSQTHGEPLPTLGVDELTGNVNNYKNFFAALESVSPVPIDFEQIPSAAKGYFSGAEQRIAIQENMSELQTVKTAIHEIAHAKLHNITPEEAANLNPEERKDRNTREVEAESVAYTVCQHYGIDTADYTFGYVAGWSSSKDAPELSASLSTIQKTANEIIRGIDERLAELTQEQTQDTAAEQPKAEITTESTAPTVNELEEKAKSGEPISVLELVDAAKSEQPRGGEKKQPAKKPSIKKQLAEEKKKAAEQPKKSAPTKKKSKDLEV